MVETLPMEQRQARGALFQKLRELAGWDRTDIQKKFGIDVIPLAAFEHGRQGSMGEAKAAVFYTRLVDAALKNLKEHPEALDCTKQRELVELADAAGLPLGDIRRLHYPEPSINLDGLDPARQAIAKLQRYEIIAERKIAAKSGLSRPKINQFIKGDYTPTSEELRKILSVFKIDSAEALVAMASDLPEDSYVQAPQVLRVLREKNHMSQADMAGALSMAKNTYSKFERRETVFPLHTLDKAAVALGYVSYNDAARSAAKEDPLSPESASWAQRVKSHNGLSELAQAQARRTAKKHESHTASVEAVKGDAGIQL